MEIAHRGNSFVFKDNTIDSFTSAVKVGFDMIELDVQITQDNVIIVYHDTFLGKNLIKNMKYTDVISLDKDIITLNKFFEIIDETSIKVYLDVKGDERIAPYLHDIIKHKNISNIYIGSFNILVIKNLYQIDKSYKLGIISENLFDYQSLQYFNSRYKPHFYCFHWSILNKDVIEQLHKNNILVFTYTCKNNELLSFMKEYNVDGIVSNYKL